MKTLEHWLNENPFELYLGAGFFGFYAHTGFIKALEEKDIKPKKIHGVSAGAIIGAMAAHSLSASQIEQIVLQIKKEDFWDPGFGLGLLKGEKYHELLARHLPEKFQDLHLPFEVAVFDLFSFRNRKLKEGDLRSAIRGSSAFPGLFQPVKTSDGYFLDGGIFDRFPAKETPVLAHCFALTSGLTKNGNHVKVSLKNLPRSGPNKMHLAKEIIEESYEQTKQLLKHPV
jgi:NTE family protein